MAIAAELDARAAQIDPSTPVPIMMPDPAQPADGDEADADEVSTFISADAGDEHTCGVRTDGAIECWGSNEYGQAAPPGGNFTSVSAGAVHTCGVGTDGAVECWGDDGIYDQAAPPGGNFTSVSAGYDHACGVGTDGAVVCWGSNGYGQAAPPGGNFTSVSAGSFHTCGVGADGAVECWGSNGSFGEFIGQATPPAGNFTSVSAGYEHTCGVRADGVAVCWGQNWRGQATPPGFSFTSVSAGAVHTCGVRADGVAACWGGNEDGQSTPPGGSFTSVSAGYDHTCGVRADGAVECWGNDRYGKTRTPDQPAPTPETAQSGESLGSFASVSAGSFHTCGVRADGVAVCWGSNEDWLGSFTGQASPPGGLFTSIDTGAGHTCGVRADGAVECWGQNWQGQATPPGFSFTSVSAGAVHTCGVRADGAVECWGSNEDGQSTPPAGNFTSVSAGTDYACGVRADGAVECWGNDGDTYDFFDHDRPPDGTFDSVSAGTFHTCGVRTDGVAVCWGSDSSGRSTPPGGSFTSVSAGYDHTCGVGADGAVECWGSNGSFGEFIGQATPPAGNFTSVSAGYEHTCGVRADGVAVCWGSNEYHQATPPDDPPDGEVPDDDHANTGRGATPIAVDTLKAGRLDYAGDADFFVFEAEEGRFYQIYVILDTLRDPAVALYDADVRPLVSNEDTDLIVSRTIWKAPRTESHHVGVTGPGGDTGSYVVLVTLYVGADDHPDSVREARPITVDEAVQGALDYHGDADVFAFEAEGGGLYRIDVSLGTLSDSVVALYDASGEELAYSDDQTHSLASLIHWGAPVAGEYYAKVTGHGIGSYTLTIMSDVGDDHGDSLEEASPVAVGDAVRGALDYAGDVDLFVFEAEGGKSYQIEVATDTLTGYTLTKYGPDGEFLGVGVTSNPQSGFSFPVF